jgi:hypothetical protein
LAPELVEQAIVAPMGLRFKRARKRGKEEKE